MADLVYNRVSTDQQSTDCQNPASIRWNERRSANCSRTRGQTNVHIYEMFRLVRDTGHILDIPVDLASLNGSHTPCTTAGETAPGVHFGSSSGSP
ncbi:hypothetical protein [Streptomyces sp. NPDC126522]|uniref:hypothetical protein n=1 Tax=Streptomyces sp. NPDC126522 TaxID=3155211 RepID=UPI00331721E4